MVDDPIQRELEFVLVSLDNLDRFSEMYWLCFGERVGARYFGWKYLQNPIGPLIAFEAIHKGKSVSLYGVIPELYEIEGERTLVYQAMDAMTHPSYQQRGIFQRLTHLTEAHLREKGRLLNIVGIPGPRSYPVFMNKLGWTRIHDFVTLFLPRAFFSVVKRLHDGPKLTFKSVRELTPELSTFLERRPRSTRPIRNALTPAFFDWRVFGHLLKRFNVVQVHDGADLVGVLVYTMNHLRRRASIHFLELAREELFMSHTPVIIERLFTETRAVAATTWKPMTEPLTVAYQRCGFFHNPFPRGPMAYRQPMIARSETGRLGSADVYDPRSYDLQPIMQD